MVENQDATAKEPISVDTFLSYMIQEFASLAWQKLGLQPDMVTQTIEKDIAQAKTAIDATSALANLLIPKLDEEDKRRVNNMLQDLRVNYLEQSKGATE
jgi:hypothetical protein